MTLILLSLTCVKYSPPTKAVFETNWRRISWGKLKPFTLGDGLDWNDQKKEM